MRTIRLLSSIALLLLSMGSLANNAMVFVFLVLTVSAAEVGVGLAIVLNLFRQRSIVNVDEATLLKG